MKRALDIAFAIFLLSFFLIPLVIIAIAVKITSEGPVLYWSDRIGANNTIFKMPKFRTMGLSTPVVATHLLRDPGKYITPIGSFLRKLSLDELPQLWSILRGDMSFIGPRPALYNQDDLVDLRTKKGIHRLVPGITGWAQVNGRDDIPISLKVEYDEYYMNNKSIILDLKIAWMTFFNILRQRGIKH
ncbi:MAG: sugar transferase [Syntrophales bacterium]